MSHPGSTASRPTLPQEFAGRPLFAVSPTHPMPAPDRVVIVAHGLTAHRRTHEPEMLGLAQLGFSVLAADAPGHGDRDDGRLAALGREPGDTARSRIFLGIIDEWAAETEALIGHLRSLGCRVGLAGVSMGGFLTYATLTGDTRPDATAAIISSPAWESPAGRAPHRSPDRFPPVPLLTVTAGLDETVPPDPARAFAERLRPLYADCPDRLHAVHFPDSGHMMRQEDWQATWVEVGTWFLRHL
ncbi:MAG: alpha/beta fold hydrolase [Candidatus Riflebacteria bacterium]|nr:alpha/beta fold hydrolase [Candidatus Riflebacteria bacterium]